MALFLVSVLAFGVVRVKSVGPFNDYEQALAQTLSERVEQERKRTNPLETMVVRCFASFSVTRTYLTNAICAQVEEELKARRRELSLLQQRADASGLSQWLFKS